MALALNNAHGDLHPSQAALSSVKGGRGAAWSHQRRGNEEGPILRVAGRPRVREMIMAHLATGRR
jgi:hypothetical protein